MFLEKTNRRVDGQHSQLAANTYKQQKIITILLGIAKYLIEKRLVYTHTPYYKLLVLLTLKLDSSESLWLRISHLFIWLS